MPFPWRQHRCKYCSKMAVTYPHGVALCATHAADPNSLANVVRLENIKKKFLDKFDVELWNEFCHRTFESDGKNYEDFTWLQMAELAELEYDRLTICTCTNPDQRCIACRMLAAEIYGREFKE